MALRDIDVDVELDVRYEELARLNEELDDTLDMLRRIDDDNVIDLTNEFRKMGKQVDDATRDVRQLNRQVETLSDARVDIDVEEAQADINRLKRQIESLDHDDINVDIDVRNATRELVKLRTMIKTIDNSDIDIDVDINGALKELAVLRAQLNAFSAPTSFSLSNLNPMGGLNLGSMIKTAAILLALPTLIPVVSVLIGGVGTLGVSVGVLAGGLLGIASAATVAGAGLIGFGSIAVSSITDLYEENAVLTSEQKKLKAEIDKLVGSWNDLKESLSDEVFDVASAGVKSFNKLLDMSEPILENAGDAVSKLLDNFNRSLKNDDVRSFFSYLESSVGLLTQSIGNGLGNALKGVGNTIVALKPLTSWMADGFENMMSDFANWTSGLSGSDKMTAFIDYVKSNLPKLGSILGDATTGVVDFFAAFDITASNGLDWLVNKMDDFSNWASNLDSNKDFQAFLDYIKENGPTIANIIGDMATSIGKLIGSLAEHGSDLLDFMSKLGDFVLKMEDAGLTDFTKSWLTVDFKDLLFGNMGSFLIDKIDLSGLIPKIDWSSFVSKLPWSTFISALNWFSFIKDINWTSFIKHIDWFSFIKSLNWPSFIKILSWSSFIKFLSWGSFIKNLGWGSFIKHLTWSSFVKGLGWTSFVHGLSWSSFIPHLSWGSFVGSIKSLVSGSHASGLGRVPYDGYVAELHDNEAVLTAQQADTLRATGMLQGDGTAPSLDMGAVSNYAPLADTGSTTTNNSSSSQNVTIHAPVTIHVEGKDSESTAKNFKDQLEEWFADLQDIFPAVLEG